MENPKNPISNVGQGMNSVKEAFDEVNSYAERYFWPMKVQIFQMIKIAFNSHVFNRLTGADNIGTDFLKNNIKAFINMLDDAELEKLFRQSESKEKQIKDLTQKVHTLL